MRISFTTVRSRPAAARRVGRERNVTCAGGLGPNERARRSAWADALGSRATAFRARPCSSTRAGRGSQSAVSAVCRASAHGTSARSRRSISPKRCRIVTASLVEPWQHRGRWFPQGIKRERGACASTLCRGCPRNCRRRVSGQLATGSLVCSWEGGRGRRSASQDICHRQRSRANASGGVSWRERRVRLL